MSARDALSEFRMFRQLVNSAFEFLVTEYGFQVAKARHILPGMWVYFRNATTQVAIHYEYGIGVWITVGRLEVRDGRVVDGEQYDLNYLLSLRAPDRDQKMHLWDLKETRLAEILNDRASVLKHHADDVLRGKFEVFERLKQVKAQRLARRSGARNR